jgi:hypothetical protein
MKIVAVVVDEVLLTFQVFRIVVDFQELTKHK